MEPNWEGLTVMSMPQSHHVSVFESIRHEDEEIGEYWSGRELARVLGYTNWRNFVKVVGKAIEACQNSGYNPEDHVVEADYMIEIGKGAHRQVTDFHLSRYACYLIVQNADPEKEVVALGQTYFAVRTREAEIAAELDTLTEDQRRLALREQLSAFNIELAETASEAGVITSQDFAIFQDWGYQGLYAGEKAREIAARKGLRRGQRILDHMNSVELGANIFRVTQTQEKIQLDGITDKVQANRTHYEVGKKVRQTIAELGGTMPEHQPTPEKSIQQLQSEERRRLEEQQQPSLFDSPDDEGME